MVFKTHEQLEFPYPLKQSESEKYYFGFELLLNISLFHLDLQLQKYKEISNSRFISCDLDLVLRTIKDKSVLSAEIYYQPCTYDDRKYKLYKVREIMSSQDGLKLIFNNGESLEDPLHKSQLTGRVYLSAEGREDK